MTIHWFHRQDDAKRRGNASPVRLRFPAHSGVSLVELMIAMLILTLVCVAWLQIIGIQSARREARRREAVERLVGMMDAFLYAQKTVSNSQGGNWEVVSALGSKSLAVQPKRETNHVYALFDADVSPIGYQLTVCSREERPQGALFGSEWDASVSKRWLVGRLFDRSGDISEVGKPFFVLPVHL